MIDYGIDEVTTPFMYVGYLKDYHYKNNDIGDLLIFLKNLKKKKIFLIDNLMTEFDSTKLPDDFEIIIIGIFGEIYHTAFLKKFIPSLENKKIIIITSQKFEIPNYLKTVKIFFLEHLHKSINFFLKPSIHRISMRNNSKIFLLKNKTRFIKDRTFLSSCLVRRVTLSRLAILSLFLRNYDFDKIIFSYINSNNFTITDYNDLLHFCFNNELSFDKKLLTKIYFGPKISTEFFVENRKKIENYSELKEYYQKADYNPVCFDIPKTLFQDYNETFNNNIDAYYNTKVNYILETNIDAFDSYEFLTEKTLKPIVAKTPFVLISSQNSYRRLERLGFKTYEDIFQIKFDEIENINIGEKLYLINKTMELVNEEFLENYLDILQEIADYNFSWMVNHFYNHCESLNKDTIDHIIEYIEKL